MSSRPSHRKGKGRVEDIISGIMDLQAEDFHHPYTPYEIQLKFMRSLYSSLEEGKVAIFESPTGKPSMIAQRSYISSL